MSENPYQPTSNSGQAAGVDDRLHIKTVAKYQKGILGCILLQMLAYLMPVFLPGELGFFASGAFVLVGAIGSLVYTILLATQIYSTGVAVLLAVLAIVPCIGLIVLLIINGKATAILRANGVKVGLFGANMKQV